MDPVTKIVILDEVVGPEPHAQTLTQEQQEERTEAAGAFAGAFFICIVLFTLGYGGLQLIKMIKRWVTK